MGDIKLFTKNLIVLYKILFVLPLAKVSKLSFVAVLLSCFIVMGTSIGFITAISILHKCVYSTRETVTFFTVYIHIGILAINLFSVKFIVLFKYIKYLPVIQNHLKQNDLLKPPHKDLIKKVQYLSNVLITSLLLIILLAFIVFISDYVILITVLEHSATFYLSLFMLTYFENIIICTVESQYIFICCLIKMRFQTLNNELMNVIDIFNSDELFQNKTNKLKKNNFINMKKMNMYNWNQKRCKISKRNLLELNRKTFCWKVQETFFKEINILPAVEEVGTNLLILMRKKSLFNASHKTLINSGYNYNISIEYITELHFRHRVLCSALSSLHKLYRTQIFLTIIVSFLLFIISVYTTVSLLLDTTKLSSYFMGSYYWMIVTSIRFATNIKVSEYAVIEVSRELSKLYLILDVTVQISLQSLENTALLIEELLF